ncbi:hypothetical protein HYW36_03380 [Candidatus Saccharibacteria bacterium]|nr:hypothetical protein [Candidatus Saccharibacteria bacterium]
MSEIPKPVGQPGEGDVGYVLSPLDIAREQSGSIAIALASPTFPEEAKEIIRQDTAEKRDRLVEAGELEAADWYDAVLQDRWLEKV